MQFRQFCSCHYGDHDFRRTGYVVLYDRAFAAYATMYFLTSEGYMEVPLILIFAMSILIGVILQLFNWVLIDRLKMKSFIATLGTQTFLKEQCLHL